MNKIRMLCKNVISHLVWIVSILGLNVFFIFMAWIAYPKDIQNLIGLMLFVSLGSCIIPLVLLARRRRKMETAFYAFLMEPNEANEYLLCEAASVSQHPYIHELANHLRKKQSILEDHAVQLEDYESYIENWAHEIKKPLSLMGLMLDNRINEMSPLVRSRMKYVHDQSEKDVEQVLYFARLGAAHKDYCWEELSVLDTCKEAVDENRSLLDEAEYMIEFSGEDCEIVSDKKGLIFLLGQLICNSVKYAADTRPPQMSFCVSMDDKDNQIVLSVSDNGKGISRADLPFIFEKGFTGEEGSYMSQSTGMGLYLVGKMAQDLAIEPRVESTPGQGTTFTFLFPKVEHKEGKNAVRE